MTTIFNFFVTQVSEIYYIIILLLMAICVIIWDNWENIKYFWRS